MKPFLKYFLIFSLAAPAFSLAQEQANKFSLQQAVEFALKNQAAMKNALNDEEIARKKVNEIIGAGMPQVKGVFDFKDWLELPASFIPGEFFGQQAGTFIPVKFGTQYNATASLEGSQLIFDGSYLVGLQASRTYLDLTKKASVQSKIETTVQVSKAYYNVLVNRERMELLNANVTRVKKLHDDTKAFYDNGFVEKLDFDRIVVAYNNIAAEKEKTEKLIALGELLLKFQMGMDINTPVELTDKLEDIKIGDVMAQAEKTDATARVEYGILQTQKRLYELDLKRNRFQFLPSVAGYAALSANAQRSEFDIFDTDKKWYSAGLLGLTVSLPIIDGFQRNARIQQSKLTLMKMDNSISQLKQGITLEVASAKTKLVNSNTSLETQRKNRELAEEIVRVSKIKYDQGVGSSLEVIDAETSLREAETNYYNAMFDALVAKLELDTALGNIK